MCARWLSKALPSARSKLEGTILGRGEPVSPDVRRQRRSAGQFAVTLQASDIRVHSGDEPVQTPDL